MVNIKVAVRIRPLSQREIIQRDAVIVRKENKFILVTNPKIPEAQDGDSRQRTRRFAVDFCYDPAEPEACSQEAVYGEIGAEILESMFDGYNACVLAYGHSASGKTYTIMGLQDDPGLTPRLCQGLFEKMEERSSVGRIRFHVFISFLEIYNEKVRDLLGNEEPGGSPSNFSLRVREHPKLGPYVQGLSQHLVRDKGKLLELLALGNRRRSTAATENNVHSSRSHAVFTIHFKQSDGENYETEKLSKVHLVDLAGSLQEVLQQDRLDERASSAQTKARLKEGANINKSLVTLGNVISALADSYGTAGLLREHCASKTWQPFVPYRNSVLTWLLKDTLGGNSHTIMIATVSPASSCLSETINTLRYAKRTKRIMNQPIVNEDPKIRTIRELKDEISRLRGLLLCLQSCRTDGASGTDTNSLRSWLKGSMGFPGSLSKWLDPGGSELTTGEEVYAKQEKLDKSSIENDTSDRETAENDGEDRKRRPRIPEATEASTRNGDERALGCGLPGAASLRSDACEVDDEKESDVNGSVIDNFSHETEIFSDSLESVSSFFLKNESSSNAENIEAVQVERNARDRGRFLLSKALRGSKRSLKLCLRREFGSFENLTKKDMAKMLHRSRPDLIRGISTRSKEGLPSTTSQSCTDISNLSHSTSENSLNSSGSVDPQTPENRPSSGLRGKGSKVSKGVDAKDENTERKENKSEVVLSNSKKKDKRLEIVEAVTTRLYVSKKKQDHKVEGTKKEEDEDDGELDELKLCKRARMKLFDLSRKLAMTRKIKKTVDSYTQTDFVSGTVRVKEKCVTTDLCGANFGTNTTPEETPREESKACVIMNQVFIPQSSNYVVECGKVMKIGLFEPASRHESGTQTMGENKPCKNANTSPIKFISQSDDCFSDDSLDLEENAKVSGLAFPGRECELPKSSDADIFNQSFYDCSVDSVTLENTKKDSKHEHFFSGPEATSQEISENVSREPRKKRESLFNELPLSFLEVKTLSAQNLSLAASASQSSFSSNSKKEETFSSENSFTSAESSDGASSSETSSADFVFYESPKDRESENKEKATTDRELYTITENSEPSDPSETLSPLQSQHSTLNVWETDPKLPSQSELGMPGSVESSDSSLVSRETVENEREKKHKDSDVGWLTTTKCHNSFQKECLSSNTGHRASAQEYKSFELSNKPHNFPVPKSEPSPTSTNDFKSCVKVSNTNSMKPSKASKETKNDIGQEEPSEVEPNQTRDTRVSWTDLHSNSQKQFINLNILNSGKPVPFSVDSHLFGKTSKKDQSTETMSASADSITFVFMGPANPKTSVLMEIIRRSLEKGSCSSATSPPREERQSRNRGVQCDSNLMRSISVDTAMIALSQIAKNQEQTGEVSRTSSLGALTSDEIQTILERSRLRGIEQNVHAWDTEADSCKEQKKKSSLKYSVCADTVRKEHAEKKIEEMEKQKKSVSWSGETKYDANEVEEQSDESRLSPTPERVISPHFNLSYSGTPDIEVEEANDTNSIENFFSNVESEVQERRVRFLKAKNRNIEDDNQGREEESEEILSKFLKEAILLLRNLNNYSSSKYRLWLNDFYEEARVGQNEQKTESQTSQLKWRPKTLESVSGDETEGSLVKAVLGMSKTRLTLEEGKYHQEFPSMTWPRRRTAPGKPPSGARPRASRSPLLSRSNSHGFPDLTRNHSQSTRIGSSGASWNISNLSVGLSNSYVGDSSARPAGSRSFRTSECRGDSCSWSNRSSPRILSPRPNFPKLNFDSLSELETDLEASCRRLEMVAEQDKIRQENFESKRRMFQYHKSETEKSSPSQCSEDNSWKEYAPVEKVRDAIKRRKTNGCAGGCTCRAETGPSCACHAWLKVCRSTFELDSFGPGSKHCPQLCIFCRRKTQEVYSSVLNLNSECFSSRCRLNHYGYCPCSPFRLSHVAATPRAYMHHLLTLRRHIVSQTKC